MFTLLIFLIIFIFSAVIFFGAPYLPTMRRQRESALDLLSLKPGQTLLELGSGDGRVMRMAARRGLKVVGYELNPFLVLISRIVTWRYRAQVQIIWGNFWRRDWPDAEGIFVFLLPKYMTKLNTKISRNSPSTLKVVSNAFEIPGKKASKVKNGVYLYRYP